MSREVPTRPNPPTRPEPVEGRGSHPPMSPEPVEGRGPQAKPATPPPISPEPQPPVSPEPQPPVSPEPVEGRGSLRGPLLRFTLLVVLVAAGFLLLRWGPIADRLDPEILTATFRRIAAHPWAPLALLVAYWLLCPLGVPVSPLLLAGGLVFGFGLGSAVNLAGCWGGAATTFLVGRLLGKDFVEHLLGDRLRRLEHLIERHAFWTLLRLRFVPIPFALVNYAAALAGVRPAVFLSATAIGLAPAIALYTWFAAALFRLAAEPDRALPVLLQFGGALLGLLALTFLPRLLGRRGGS